LGRNSVLQLCCAALLATRGPDALTVRLQPRTNEAFDAYVRSTGERFERRLRQGLFLWVDESAERKRQVLNGKILAEPLVGRGDIAVPDGLIHDWIGAAFIPGVTLSKTLAMVEDYDHHAEAYKPEVLASRLISRHDDDFHISMRLLKKQILTVVLDTEHEVQYRKVDDERWYSRSRTLRIAEVLDPGTNTERLLPPGVGHGFLWRLNSYWKFAERDGGVYIECEPISLTRDVPTGLGWIINPIIRSFPRDSLINSLRKTRAAVQQAPGSH
jgi:hypothetical protein